MMTRSSRCTREGWLRGWAVAVVLAAALPAAAAFPHGRPAYDSGWQDLTAGAAITLTHDLGVATDDLVVDLQLRDTDGDLGVHVAGFGLDRYLGVTTGAHWRVLTSTTVEVFRASGDTSCDQGRIRIWHVPDADYDSGWFALATSQSVSLSHSLGGSVDDYLVYLELRDDGDWGVHSSTYGGDGFVYLVDMNWGVFWEDLSTSEVRVTRLRSSNDRLDGVRVRVWRAPAADYDSGWTSIARSTAELFEHGLGGPWNDLVVDLQFKDVAEGYGINHLGFGGDSVDSTTSPDGFFGAYWRRLKGSGLEVVRNDHDLAADQVRVRVWEDRSARYDSGWLDPGEGTPLLLDHQLSGDPDAWVVDLQFFSSEVVNLQPIGRNQQAYGGDITCDSEAFFGAWWHDLDDAGVSVTRAGPFPEDEMIDRIRLRIWQAPEPDWDSGWLAVGQGEAYSFRHDIGANPDEYVVDLQFEDVGGVGVHHRGFGSDRYEVGADCSASATIGAYWLNLGTEYISVGRGSDDTLVDRARIRIWRNTAFDYDSGWLLDPGLVAHDLATDPDRLVVDLQRDPGDGPDVFHYGRDWVESLDTFLGASRPGFTWWMLDSQDVGVQGEWGLYADHPLRTRIWDTGYVQPQPKLLTVVRTGDGSSTVTSGPAGIDCGSDCDEAFPYGTDVMLYPVSAATSTFTGWGGDLQCLNGYVTMSEHLRCTARFDLVYHDLTVSLAGSGSGVVVSTPAGIDCGSDCSASFVQTTAVTLATAPAAGSVFAGWTGDADCSDGQVVMSADRSCTAWFELQTEQVFADGFESGDTRVWSGVMP